jgi:putative hydrolase of the HAD superfamily
MSRVPTIRAVLFDYYFTLVDPEAPQAHAAAAALLDGGDHAEVLRTWRTLQTPDIDRAIDGEPPPFRTLGARWADGGGSLFELLGLEHEPSHWEACRAASHANAPLYDDVAPVLDVLRTKGIKVGVLSDADTAWLHESIERNDLRLDAVVCSEELRCYKPHRSLFLAACEAIGGGVAPEDCAYVGDNPRADVVGSRNAGMTSVWINRVNRAWPDDLEPADHELHTLADLPAALDL